MNDLINGEIFSTSSQQLIRHLYDIIFSGGTLLIVIVILSLKLLGSKNGSYIINFINNKFPFYKKIVSSITPIEEDVKNIFYGLIGMMFTWTIVSLFFEILQDFLKGMNLPTGSKETTLLQSQIEFANSIDHFLRYLGVIEVIIIFMAFMMLFLSFLGSVFKTSAKIIGAGAIILATGAVVIGYYTNIIREIAGNI